MPMLGKLCKELETETCICSLQACTVSSAGRITTSSFLSKPVLPTRIHRYDVLRDKSWNSTWRSQSVARFIIRWQVASGPCCSLPWQSPTQHLQHCTFGGALERLGIGWTVDACFNAAWLARFHIRPRKGGPWRRQHINGPPSHLARVLDGVRPTASAPAHRIPIQFILHSLRRQHAGRAVAQTPKIRRLAAKWSKWASDTSFCASWNWLGACGPSVTVVPNLYRAVGFF